MDRSNEYIEMCQGALWIQGDNWSAKQADNCCLLDGESKRVGFLIANPASRDDTGRGFSDSNYLLFQSFDESTGINRGFSNWTFNKKNYVWLPRIDQLVEMNEGKFGEIEPVPVFLFLALLITDGNYLSEYWSKFDTIEKFLFAFYILDEKKKVWDSRRKEWIEYSDENVDLMVKNAVNVVSQLSSNQDVIESRLGD